MDKFPRDIQWCLNIFTTMGVNPYKRGAIHNFIFVFWVIALSGNVFIASYILFTTENMQEVQNFSNAANNLLINPHGILALVVMFYRRNEVEILFNHTKDTFWPIDDTEEVKRDERLRSLLKDLFFYFCSLCVLSTIIKPIVTGEGALAFKEYKPLFVPRYFFLILDDISCAGSLMAIYFVDVIMLVLLMMAAVQYRMLNNKLTKLFDEDKNEKITKSLVMKRIKECVDHQIFLMEFLNLFNTNFSGVLLMVLGAVIPSMSSKMYIISSDVLINYKIEAFFHIIAGITEIALCFAIPAQALTNQTDEMNNHVYHSNWYEYPKEAKDILCIMFRQAKRIEITAGGIVILDLKMFVVAVKTIVSYCLFLKSVTVLK